jgi:hypothetical protein
MLGNSKKICSKYVEFYDLPVLFTLVSSTSARRQGVAKKSIILQAQSRNFMDIWNFMEKGSMLMLH